jgi:hypothetical protein
MMKKALLVMFTMAFLSTSAMAGTRPEFDVVGDDQSNTFNCLAEGLVLENNGWNASSDFAAEAFVAPAELTEDLCFPGYYSALTTRQRAAQYKYTIVLQMDPETDLDINIQDCVYQNNSETIFGSTASTGAFQTGRAINFLGDNYFYDARNPMVTVRAIPGPYAVSGFTTPFYMTNKTQGGFYELPFVNVLYTSKAIWEESLVARMPQWQMNGPQDTMEYPLSAGDIIEVTIDIPHNGVTDLRYGEDNVSIKYVGESGTVYTADVDAIE